MRIEDLPSPGALTMAHDLRRYAAQAISQMQIVADITPGGKLDTGNSLHAFFLACAAEVEPYKLPPEEPTKETK